MFHADRQTDGQIEQKLVAFHNFANAPGIGAYTTSGFHCHKAAVCDVCHSRVRLEVTAYGTHNTVADFHGYDWAWVTKSIDFHHNVSMKSLQILVHDFVRVISVNGNLNF